jgi:uncharacterized RDD family membrane protein YckC
VTTIERGIVTPEAVVLEFDLAGIASRSLARAIDAVLQGAALFALLALAGSAFGGEGAVALIVVIVGVALVLLGYPILCEVLMRGRSPGKAALGIRVVTVEGAPISPRHAFIRSALGLVDFIVVPGGMVAVLCALLTRRSQRLGDVFAGTMVLRERSASSSARAVWFNPPAGLEAYAATLDVSRVTDAQFALVRSFLLRIGDLSPEARASLSVRLSTPLCGVMAHQAPRGVYADQFLQCVAAAFQRRYTPAPVSAPGWGAAPPPPPPPPPPAFPPPPPPPSAPAPVAPSPARSDRDADGSDGFVAPS